VFVPHVVFFIERNRDGAGGAQPDEVGAGRLSRFLMQFPLRGVFRRFSALAAAGDPLPDAGIGAPEEGVLECARSGLYKREHEDVERCSGHDLPFSP
jgi:hypothetical protein